MAVPEPPRWCLAIVMLCNLLTVISITTFLFYKILRSHRALPDGNKRIFCTAITFMAVNWTFTFCVIIAVIYNIVFYFYTEHDIPVSTYLVLNAIVMFLILLQNYLLLIALFVRLSNLFRSGPLRLSRCTTTMYTVVLTLMPILCLCVPVIRVMGADVRWQRIFAFAVIFLAEIVLCSLLSMFAVKLNQVQKNKTLIAYQRRQSILALLTVFNNFCFLVVVGWQISTDPDRYGQPGYRWIEFVECFFLPFHILCNFLSIALSYRCCDSLIVLLCGCLRCCKVIPITTADHDAIFLEQIMRNSNDQNAGNPNQTNHTVPTTKTVTIEVVATGNSPDRQYAIGEPVPSPIRIIYEY